MLSGPKLQRFIVWPMILARNLRYIRKYMIEDKKNRHANKPHFIYDAKIMIIFILFHSGSFRCFKYYYIAKYPQLFRL